MDMQSTSATTPSSQSIMKMTHIGIGGKGGKRSPMVFAEPATPSSQQLSPAHSTITPVISNVTNSKYYNNSNHNNTSPSNTTTTNSTTDGNIIKSRLSGSGPSPANNQSRYRSTQQPLTTFSGGKDRISGSDSLTIITGNHRERDNDETRNDKNNSDGHSISDRSTGSSIKRKPSEDPPPDLNLGPGSPYEPISTISVQEEPEGSHIANRKMKVVPLDDNDVRQQQQSSNSNVIDGTNNNSIVHTISHSNRHYLPTTTTPITTPTNSNHVNNKSSGKVSVAPTPSPSSTTSSPREGGRHSRSLERFQRSPQKRDDSPQPRRIRSRSDSRSPTKGHRNSGERSNYNSSTPAYRRSKYFGEDGREDIEDRQQQQQRHPQKQESSDARKTSSPRSSHPYRVKSPSTKKTTFLETSSQQSSYYTMDKSLPSVETFQTNQKYSVHYNGKSRGGDHYQHHVNAVGEIDEAGYDNFLDRAVTNCGDIVYATVTAVGAVGIDSNEASNGNGNIGVASRRGMGRGDNHHDDDDEVVAVIVPNLSDVTGATHVSAEPSNHKDGKKHRPGTSNKHDRRSMSGSAILDRGLASTGGDDHAPSSPCSSGWWINMFHRMQYEHDAERERWQKDLIVAQEKKLKYKKELKGSLVNQLQWLEDRMTLPDHLVPGISRVSTNASLESPTATAASITHGSTWYSQEGIEITVDQAVHMKRIHQLEQALQETIEQHEQDRQQWYAALEEAAAVTATGEQLSFKQQQQLIAIQKEAQTAVQKQRLQWKEKTRVLTELLELTEQQHKQEIQQWNMEKATLQQSIEDLTAEKNEINEALVRANADMNELTDDADQAFEEAAIQKEQAASALKLCNDFEEQASAALKEAEDFKDQAFKAQAEKLEMKQRAEQAQSLAEAAQNEAMRWRTIAEKAMNDADEVRRQMTLSRDEIAVTKDSTIQQVKQQVETLQTQLNASNEQATTALKLCNEYKEQLDEMRNDMIELERELDNMNENYESLQNENEALILQVEQQGQLMEAKHKEVEALKSQMDTTNEELRKELEATKEELESTKTNLEKELDLTKSELETTKHELEGSQQQVESTRSELESTANELEGAKVEIHATKQVVETTKAKCQTLTKELELAKEELDSLNKLLESTKAELEACKVEAGTSQKEMNDAKVTIDKLKAELESSKKEVESSKKQVDSLKKEIKDLCAQAADFTEQAISSQKQCRKLQKNLQDAVSPRENDKSNTSTSNSATNRYGSRIPGYGSSSNGQRTKLTFSNTKSDSPDWEDKLDRAMAERDLYKQESDNIAERLERVLAERDLFQQELESAQEEIVKLKKEIEVRIEAESEALSHCDRYKQDAIAALEQLKDLMGEVDEKEEKWRQLESTKEQHGPTGDCIRVVDGSTSPQDEVNDAKSLLSRLAAAETERDLFKKRSIEATEAFRKVKAQLKEEQSNKSVESSPDVTEFDLRDQLHKQQIQLTESSNSEIMRKYKESIEQQNDLVNRLKMLEMQRSNEKGSWKLQLEGALAETRKLVEEKRILESKIDVLKSKHSDEIRRLEELYIGTNQQQHSLDSTLNIKRGEQGLAPVLTYQVHAPGGHDVENIDEEDNFEERIDKIAKQEDGFEEGLIQEMHEQTYGLHGIITEKTSASQDDTVSLSTNKEVLLQWERESKEWATLIQDANEYNRRLMVENDELKCDLEQCRELQEQTRNQLEQAMMDIDDYKEEIDFLRRNQDGNLSDVTSSFKTRQDIIYQLNRHQDIFTHAVDELQKDVLAIKEKIVANSKQPSVADDAVQDQMKGGGSLDQNQRNLEDLVAGLSRDADSVSQYQRTIKSLAEETKLQLDNNVDDRSRFHEQQELLLQEIGQLRQHLLHPALDPENGTRSDDLVAKELVAELQRKESSLVALKEELDKLREKLDIERTKREKTECKNAGLNAQVQAYSEELIHLQAVNAKLVERIEAREELYMDPELSYYEDLTKSKSWEQNNNSGTSPLLEEALALAEGFNDVVNGKKHFKKDPSAMEILESLSDMMDKHDTSGRKFMISSEKEPIKIDLQHHNNTDRYQSRPDYIEVIHAESSMSDHSGPNSNLFSKIKSSSVFHRRSLPPTPTSIVVKTPLPLQNTPLQVLVDQLYSRCAMLERERVKLMEITLDLLESARTADEVELNEALTLARQRSTEEMSKVREQSKIDQDRIFHKLCRKSIEDGVLLKDINNKGNSSCNTTSTKMS